MKPAGFFLLLCWLSGSVFAQLPYPATDDTAVTKNGDIQEDRALARETSPLKWTALALIRLYQKMASPQYGDVCNFTPSCSHFGFASFKKYGFVQGFLMTADRLQRCNYWAFGKYPYDPTSGKLLDPISKHALWGTRADH